MPYRDQRTILIIEDDVDTRDLLARLLSAEGYGVRLAGNAWEALLMLESPPHLIVLDVMLPGMDGFAFLRSLRGQRTYQAIPVVVFTAMETEMVAARVRPYGVAHVVPKDDTMYPRLQSAIRKVLGQPRPHARVELPEPGSIVRPYLDLYVKMLLCS
jgi:CheY-like chemotaxis protein